MSLNEVTARLVAEWDQVLVLLAFGVLTVETAGYVATARQFPLVFLLAGLLFMGVQLLSTVLPPRYSKHIESFTRGIASEMELPGDDGGEPDRERRSLPFGHESTYRRRLMLILAILAVFLAVMTYFGFLLAVPVLVLAAVLTLGSGNLRAAAVTTALILLGLYVIFGILLNVPLMEGRIW